MVDERGELSAMHRGISENDLGMRTDVLNNIDKITRDGNANPKYGSKGNSCR